MDPITWIFIIVISAVGGAAGAVVVKFWDRIKAWAERTALQILNVIDQAIEYTADALTFLIKEGRAYFKEVVVYTKNLLNDDEFHANIQRVRVSRDEIPEEVREQLGLDNVQNERVGVLRMET